MVICESSCQHDAINIHLGIVQSRLSVGMPHPNWMRDENIHLINDEVIANLHGNGNADLRKWNMKCLYIVTAYVLFLTKEQNY